MRIIPIGIAIALVMMAFAVQAEPKCTPTVALKAANYPGSGAIPSTNNLLLPTGKAVETQAQKLIIQGTLVDSRCAPIDEAVIELWQLNPFGKWYLIDREEMVTPQPVFAGAGRTVTDHDGRFTFITGFPGTTSVRIKEKQGKKIVTSTISRAPYVNLRIKAKGFETFTTMLYFEGDRRNSRDPAYTKLAAEKRVGVTLKMQPADSGELIATQTIVLQGKTPYRTY